MRGHPHSCRPQKKDSGNNTFISLPHGPRVRQAHAARQDRLIFACGWHDGRVEGVGGTRFGRNLRRRPATARPESVTNWRGQRSDRGDSIALREHASVVRSTRPRHQIPGATYPPRTPTSWAAAWPVAAGCSRGAPCGWKMTSETCGSSGGQAGGSMFRALYPAKRRTREKKTEATSWLFRKVRDAPVLASFLRYLNRVRLEFDRGVSAEENIFVPEKVL